MKVMWLDNPSSHALARCTSPADLVNCTETPIDSKDIYCSEEYSCTQETYLSVIRSFVIKCFYATDLATFKAENSYMLDSAAMKLRRPQMASPSDENLEELLKDNVVVIRNYFHRGGDGWAICVSPSPDNGKTFFDTKIVLKFFYQLVDEKPDDQK
mmetsp:Transcript_30519/g.47012  ORF Transcript_30519/g.47012 Transcript_30519/m.47012 type:complete len:156 (+) Transcript_30519:769-1236(+)